MSCLNENYDKPARAEHAIGKRLRINGRWVLDTSMGAGTCIFGHGLVRSYADLFIVPGKQADENAEILTQTGHAYTVWCNSGTEATMRAMRIARAHTGRDKVAVFTGGWHGTHDYGLVGISAGIPAAISDLMVTFNWELDDLRLLEARDIAAVMVEPIQASLPIDHSEYLRELRETCTRTGTALIFDELISGFRVDLNGAAGLYNVTPDITCYGKVLGGGLPIGAVCGGQVMETIRTKHVRMGGTFSGNPATMTSCNRVLRKLLHHDIYPRLHQIVDALMTIRKNYYLLTHHGMARIIYSPEPVNSIEERDRLETPKAKQDEIRSKALDKGVYLNSNNCIMLSTLHNLTDVNKILEVLDEVTEY